ncbi:MAG: type II secretion system protein [Candidatus Lariskella arthropodorum]
MYKMRFNRKLQKGYTLIELGLTLVIIGVAIVSVLYAYALTKLSYNISELNQQIQMIRVAEDEYMLEANTRQATAVSHLYQMGYTSIDFGLNGSVFGTNFHIEPVGNQIYKLSVLVPNRKVCWRLVNDWGRHDPSANAECLGNELSITFDESDGYNDQYHNSHITYTAQHADNFA